MSVHSLRHGRGLRRARLGALLLVLAASLGGVVALGLGEAWRGDARLQFERLAAQGAILQGPVEMFLRVGMALEQFTGFTQLARTLRQADPTLEAVRVLDDQGRLLFSEPPGPEVPATAAHRVPPLPHQRFAVTEDAHSFRVSLPLSDRFGEVGRLELVMSREAVSQRVLRRFQPLFTLLGGCLLFLGAFVSGAQRLWMRHPRRWLGAAFSLCFLALTLATSLALADLYSDGLHQRTSSLAHSLARRLNEAARLGLTLSHLRGLDTLLEEYQRTNADLGSLALIADERVLVQVDAGAGRTGDERFEYTIDLELTEGPWNLPVRLEVDAAKGALQARLWRTAPGFLFLFAASSLLGLLVLGALSPLPRRGSGSRVFEQRTVGRLQPLAFLGGFLEGLPFAFLPVAAEALLPVGGAALLAVVFQGACALALVPSERYARRGHLGRWLVVALGVSTAAFALMAFTSDLRAWLVLRGLCGFGLGALAAGTRAYLLAALPPGQPPRRMARLTLARGGGLLAGTVLGALVAAHQGPSPVFLFAALCGLGALAYSRHWLPPVEARDRSAGPRAFRASLTHPPLPPGAWSPRDHRWALLFVGLPSWLSRGGVLGLVLPLWLVGEGQDTDRIGQLLALVALGALVPHALPARLDGSRRLLQGGVLGTGLSLLALSAFGSLEPVRALALCLLGMSLGLVHVPLDHHVESQAAESTRRRSWAAITPLLSALAQCVGPLLVSAFWRPPEDPLPVLGGLGVGVLLLGAAHSWMTRASPGREVRHA
ncbi:MFS transporter [Corallococcus exiguus]|uniref:MFS transporter n=1 Tax=Corallococcus exiguus TaxID=83462 RepID=UPI0015619C58|nr:MFS transporter [Corallococcus exiguus]NRD61653.1 MFS transporter [Corallococcus exiguus]